MPEITGSVKDYDGRRAFGWVAGDDGRLYFVHRSEILGPPLRDGERVVFDGVVAARGPRAVGVRRVTEATSARA